MRAWNRVASRYPFATRLAAWVLLPLGTAAALGYGLVLRSLPPVSGSLALAGLVQPATIERDQQGVPSIVATTDTDAYFALGVAHAEDRLWQMEMQRRLGSGRLAEVLGESAVGSDVFFRTLGLARRAHQQWEALSPDARAVLRAYVNGVNAGIGSLTALPPEFALTDYRPEPWRPEDSLLWMQVMAWQLSGNLAQEAQRAQLLQLLGASKTRILMGETPDQPAEEYRSARRRPASAAPLVGAPNPFEPRRFVGSNAWAVSGRWTASGQAMLANDPHLPLSVPSLWYLARLRGATLDVQGATIPGLPFVVIGRNRDIAWGMTTMMADTQDIVLERIDPRDRNRYEWQGTSQPMTVQTETIRIRRDWLKPARPDLQIRVRRTRNGPLLSDVAGPINGLPFSVRWSGDDDTTGSTFSSFVALNRVHDWAGFNAALRGFVAPAHNFVYADRAGNIGYLAPAAFPLRAQGEGTLPVAGWALSDVWTGMLPYERVPRRYNPPEGIIVSANDDAPGPTFVPRLSYDWDPGYRAARIRAELQRLISSGLRIGQEEMARLQGDVTAYAGHDRALRHLLALQPTNDLERAALDQVRRWDGRMTVDSSAPTIVNAWLSHLVALLLDGQSTQASGEDGARVLASFNFENEPFVERVLSVPASPWCNTSGEAPADCAPIVRRALARAVAELSERFGPDPADWRWGRVHHAQFPHFPFSDAHLAPGWPAVRRHPLAWLFHRDLPTDGGTNTVAVAPPSYQSASKYLQFNGATYRQRIDFGASALSCFGQSTGQSGNLLSPHYDDLLAVAGGACLPMARQTSRATLRLVPRQGD